MTIIQDLISNSKEFRDYISSNRTFVSTGVEIKEWVNSFKLNDKYYDILFIYYEDLFKYYELYQNTTIDQLKDRVVGFFCIKKNYRDDEYEIIKNRFEIVNKSVTINWEGQKCNTIVIAVDVMNLYDALNPLIAGTRVEGFDFVPSSGAEMKTNTNGEILLSDTPSTPPGFVGQPASGFVFEFTSGNINTDYPDRIEPMKIDEKLIENRPNKIPYKTVKQQKLETDLLLSEQNKAKIVRAFNSSIQKKKKDCFEHMRSISKNYNDLYNNIVSKLDFGVLGSLVLSQINAFIESDENELICSTQQIKDLLLCPVLTDPFNIPNLNKLNNGGVSSINIPTINIPNIEINFDFFQTIRDLIEDKIVEYMIRMLNEILDNVFEIMDCSDVNQFLIKCKNTIDLRDHSFLAVNDLTNFFNNTANETYFNIQNRLNDFNIGIDLQQYLSVVKKIFSSLNLSQIQSIVNGVFSGQLYKLIKNLIQSILGDRVDEKKYVSILQIIQETSDASVLSDNTNPIHDSCIHYMPYDYIKANLIANGCTNEEADQKIDEDKKRKVNTGKLLCSLLRDSVDDYDSSRFAGKKSDITKYSMEKSIDHIYDSIGRHRYSHIRTVLQRILIKTFGDMCVAAWKTFPSNSLDDAEDRFLEKFDNSNNSLSLIDLYSDFFENQTYKDKYDLHSVSGLVENFILARGDSGGVYFGTNTPDHFFFKSNSSALYFKDFNGLEFILDTQEQDFELSPPGSAKNFFAQKLLELSPENTQLASAIRSSQIDEVSIFNKLYSRHNRRYSDLMSTFFSQEICQNSIQNINQTEKFKLSFLDFFQIERSRREAKRTLLND